MTTLAAVESRSRLNAFCEWVMRPAVLIRIVLYVAVVLYLRTIFFDYVYDDNTLITINPWMDSWKYIPAFFTHSFWSFGEGSRNIDFYRPLVMLVLASVHRLLGPAPGWLHLTAAAIHIGATYLTYRLAVETTHNKTLSAIASGIFGLHPTKVETAAWISGISDSLCVVFFLGSMIQYFRWKQSGANRASKRLIASLLLLGLALLSKEAAIFSPLLIAIYEFSSSEGSLRNRCRDALRRAWPFAAVAAAALAVRILIVHVPTGDVLNTVPALTTIFTAPKTVLWYLGKQLWPIGLSVQYQPLIVSVPTFVTFVLPSCILIVVLFGVVAAVRRSPIGVFFASWFVLMLAPVVLYQASLQQHDRYVYLASVATSIGIAYLLEQLRRIGSVAQATIVLALFASLALLTFNYMSYWDNDLKLFTRAVQLAPDNHNACRYLVGVYLNVRQPEKAEAIARNLMSTPKNRAEGWYLLGVVRMEARDFEHAHEAMEEAYRLSEGKTLAPVLGLASVDRKLGKNQEATQLYREAISQYPQMAYLHRNLAETLKEMGNSQEAAQELNIQTHLQ